jgi:hypothetical protein
MVSEQAKCTPSRERLDLVASKSVLIHSRSEIGIQHGG